MRNYNRRNSRNNIGRVNRKNNSGKLHSLKYQFDSNGPNGKVRGTASQLVEKYLSSAQDAKIAGDKILSEIYLQMTEHYLRLITNYHLENPQSKKTEENLEDKKDS